MFNPVPPGPAEPAAKPPEPDHDPLPAGPSWRPRGRWPALFRLSGLCRLLAVLSLLAGALGALVALIMALGADDQFRLARLLSAVGAIASGLVAYIFWCGIAEAILLLIALERNTRQTRDRLPKHQVEEP